MPSRTQWPSKKQGPQSYNCRKLNEQYANVSVLILATEGKSTMPQNKEKLEILNIDHNYSQT